MSSRPENQMPAEIFYNKDEAKKYTAMSRIIEIQSQLTERSIELLNLGDKKGLLILDIGCGSGLSGQILTDEGHLWIGIDISRAMLDVAQERKAEGDLLQIDMGQGFNFRPGVFDAAISVSALQWLCVVAKKHYNPVHRLNSFFGSLYKSLNAGGRAVLQFYPDGVKQLDMITKSAMKSGFSGNLVVDYPNSSKAKKMYLVLDAGSQTNQGIIRVDGIQEEEQVEDEKVKFEVSAKSKKIKKFRSNPNQKLKKTSKQWIMKKKDRQRRQGKTVKSDSKYSGRNRGLIRVLK